ncbi:MAG: coproporphyrinogen III oxidase family protein [Spirochaetes bacterium]|nr:coproporphyrinogen III oxidase family protein [Spirochaetota bacterium]
MTGARREAPPHLYLGTPFCRGVCAFCNFYKTDLRTYRRYFGEEGRFADAVRRELDLWMPELPARLSTVYIGGGSPLELPDGSLLTLLRDLHRRFDLREAEITVEANPSWPADRAALESGLINRLSIGVQTFSPAGLSLLHRDKIPDPDFLNRVGALVENVSMDLLYDIPGMGESVVRDDLERALAYGPKHLSWYGLEITSENYRRRLPAPDPAAWEKQRGILEAGLGAAGFHRYELSNWAREGWESRHNRAYWECKPYLGIGPAAWGQAVDGEGHPFRYLNTRHPGFWRDAVEGGKWPREETERLGTRELANEFVFLSLRTTEGLDLGEYERRFGEAFEVKFAPALGRLNPCFIKENGHFRLSERGALYYNTVCADLMIVEEPA